MVSALGYGAAASCAAARAGVTRPEELDYFVYRSPEDGENEFAIGHPVRDITLGFEGRARLLRLTQAALTDFRRNLPGSSLVKKRSAFYLSVPDPNRRLTGFDLVRDEETRLTMKEEEEEAADDPQDPDVWANLLQSAAKGADWPGETRLEFVSTSGHTGVAEAMDRAIRDLHAGHVDSAVVGGIDSLLDEVTLTWLENAGRLKRAGNPAGLMPGEAAGFFLLEMDDAREVIGPTFGSVVGLETGEEADTLLKGNPALARGLSEVLSRLLEGADTPDQDPAWIVTDQNGEPYRAVEWGNALLRLVQRHPGLVTPVVWYPAAAFGDIGAATGAAAIGMVTQSYRRGYAPAKTATIVLTADGLSRAAMSITAP